MYWRTGMLIITAVLLADCAHHRDVRPGPNGINTVILKTESSDGAYRNARSQSEHYCAQYGKRPIILKEKSNYKGTMDEGSYNTGKSVAKVAKVVGAVTFIGGNRDVSNGGAVVGLGGVAGDAYLGDAYSYTVRFRCVKDWDQ